MVALAGVVPSDGNAYAEKSMQGVGTSVSIVFHAFKTAQHPACMSCQYLENRFCSSRFSYLLMHLLSPFLLASLACAARVPYAGYILAPASRDLVPVSVHQVNGSVTNPKALTQSSGESTTLHGVSSVTYDFGKNVAGLVSLEVGSASSSSAFLGVTFSESSLYASSEASDATADAGLDTPLWFAVGQGPGKYTPEEKYLRGAFRYLTIVSNTSATVSLQSLHVRFLAAPMQDLREYTGWFHCDDELINKIWYAGAYTNQLCTINPSHGNALVHLGNVSSTDNITLPETVTWWNNYTITNGNSTITDGAKRDRLVWPGDMSIALESIAVSPVTCTAFKWRSSRYSRYSSPTAAFHTRGNLSLTL